MSNEVNKDWTEVMSKQEQKRRKQQKYREQRSFEKKRVRKIRISLKKSLHIDLISYKAFVNRLNYGRKKMDIEARERVWSIMNHMHFVNNVNDQINYLRRFTQPKIHSVLQWNSISFKNPIYETQKDMEESILQHLGI